MSRIPVFIWYLSAFVLTPVVVGTFNATTLRLAPEPGAPHALAAPPPPTETSPDSERPLVVVVVGRRGTSAVELAVPFALFSASDAFDVYTASASRDPAPLDPGAAILPDLTFRELSARFPDGPDLVVVPRLREPEEPTVVEWLRRVAHDGGELFAIGDGAVTVAAAGLLDEREATAHFLALDELRQRFPRTKWIGDVRWVVDGAIRTSVGSAAAVDATHDAIRKLAGDAVADATAERLGYDRRRRPLRPQRLTARDRAIGWLDLCFRFGQDRLGALVYPGVDEVHLAVLLDVFSRSKAWRPETVALTGEPIVTQHGLTLIATHELPTAPAFARLLLPHGDTRHVPRIALDAWAERTGSSHRPLPAAAPDEAFEQMLTELSRNQSEPLAVRVSKLVQYPRRRLDIGLGRDWPWGQSLLPVAYGLAGVALVWIARRLAGPRAR